MPSRAADTSSLLWLLVHSVCVPAMKTIGNPAPCLLVDLDEGEDNGFAVVPTPLSRSEVLLVPTARIGGLEDPLLQMRQRPNYWAEAWRQRSQLEKRLSRPIARDWIGMAVNSGIARTQDQLHIHIDCVDPEVRRALAAHRTALGDHWKKLDLGPRDHVYRAKRIRDGDLAATDPFRVLAAEVPANELAESTLALIGMTFPDGKSGFAMLTRRGNAKLGDDAAGGELLDDECKQESRKTD